MAALLRRPRGVVVAASKLRAALLRLTGSETIAACDILAGTFKPEEHAA
jgi:hypothetical protein